MQVHSRADIMSDDGHHNPIDSDDDFEGELELSFPFPLDPGDASDAGNDDAPYEGLALHHVPPQPVARGVLGVGGFAAAGGMAAPALRPPRPDNPIAALFLAAETAETNGFRVAATAAQQHPFGAAVAAASRAPAFSTVAWSCKADLPAARDEAACVAHEGRVWVLGGCVDHRVSASVIVYGAEADAWDPDAVPALPSPCRGCQAATVDGEVLLCHQGRVVAHGAGPGWRDLGAAGAAGATRQVLGSLLLG